MNNLVPRRDRFFDFDLGHVTEAGKVENCRFLENCSTEFAQNQQKKSVFNILSPSIIKKIQNREWKFPDFFDFTLCRGAKLKKNRFFQILTFALLILSAVRVSKSDHAAWFSSKFVKKFSRNRQFSTLPASVTWPRSKLKNRSRLGTGLFIYLNVAENRLYISCKTAAQCVPQEKTI